MNSWYTSEECQEAMRLYQNGLSLNETAKKYNKTRAVIQYAVKKYNVKSCISFEEGQRIANERRSKGELPMPKYNTSPSFRKRCESELADKIKQSGFEYIGGYAPRKDNPTIKVRCCICGTVKELKSHSLYNKRAKGIRITCLNCKQEHIRQEKLIEQERKQTEQERKRAEREQKRQSIIEQREQRLNQKHLCKVCGCEYTIRDYMQSIGTKYERNSGFCSVECRDKRKKELVKEYRARGTHSSGKHTSRARKFGCKSDKGITLKKLIKRDGLRCAICGEMCDLNDRSYGKWCGAKYPSIDHIYPLSKGGGNTWDNVQIAHIICNSRKETTIPERVKPRAYMP